MKIFSFNLTTLMNNFCCKNQLLFIIKTLLVSLFLLYVNIKEGNCTDILKINKTITSPIIDGIEDNIWENETSIPLEKYYGTIPSESDLRCEFKTIYDDQFIFFLIKIIDDTLVADKENYYCGDVIQLYFDGDYSQTPNDYDGVDDINLNFNFGFETIEDIPLGFWNYWDFDKRGIQYAKTTNNTGWILEIKIPLQSLNISSFPNLPFGFEIRYTDQDASCYDHTVQWWSNNTEIYKDASLFGTAEFNNSTGSNEPDNPEYEIGVWNGKTSKNQDIYFHVNDNFKIDSIAVKIKVDFITYYCIYTFYSALDISIDKETKQFEAKLTNPFIFICGESDYPTITGAFTDNNNCNGTISSFKQCGGLCGDKLTFGSGSNVGELTWSTTGEIDFSNNINEISVKDLIKCYPNPISDVLYIEGIENEMTYISILSLEGKLLKRVIDKGIKQIDLGDLHKGIYLLKISNSKLIYSKEFIKQ